MHKPHHLPKTLLMSAVISFVISPNLYAGGFQLLEQDAISVGDYHAGAFSIADDASTGWYNPAGLVRLKNQQVIAGSNFVVTDINFKGTVVVDKLMDSLLPQFANAQGGGFNTVPFGHYAAPISDRVVFGLSAVVPFGLKTDYGDDTIARYAATLTSLEVLDVTPSLGVALTDKLSLGLGFDVQRLRGEFDLVGTVIDSSMDTHSTNVLYNTGYGYHLGGLYQFTPHTRLGIGYHSKVAHHMEGHSDFVGPLANDVTGGSQISNDASGDIMMPAMTTVSLFHALNSSWDVMGALSYIQWSVLENLVLHNAAGIIEDVGSSNSITVVVPEHYHDTWNIALGAHYHPSDKWIIRTGIGYDQTPSSNTYRNLQAPDSDRYILAIGCGYQLTKTIALDAGYLHLFVKNTQINHLTQVIGGHTSVTNGAVNSSANVYGIQIKWDML